MRNFNTSFVKNAIRRFANEASNVLRASTDPASHLLRFKQSIVRTVKVCALPENYRQPHVALASGTIAGQATLAAQVDRDMSTMTGEIFGGQAGIRQWDCLASQTTS